MSKKTNQSSKHSRQASSNTLAGSLKAFKTTRDMLGTSNAFPDILKSFQAPKDMLGTSNAISDILKPFLMTKDMLGTSNAFPDILKSFQTPKDMLGTSNAISNTLKSFQTATKLQAAHNAMSDSLLKSFQTTKLSQNAKGALSTILDSLSHAENFSNALHLVSKKISLEEYVEPDTIDLQTLETNLDSLSSPANSESFLAIFSKTPVWIQVFLINFFMYIVLPHLNNISANLLTPHINEVMLNTGNKTVEKVRAVKKITTSKNLQISDDIRFISGESVHLRSEPSIKSEILDLLHIGQIVLFMEKERNWTCVMIEYENGDLETGWVFTRYVKKFKR